MTKSFAIAAYRRRERGTAGLTALRLLDIMVAVQRLLFAGIKTKLAELNVRHGSDLYFCESNWIACVQY
tara:strand:+ start:75 stop:281 length:207 start_codon:yes stop_codon:yes gene_type:complete